MLRASAATLVAIAGLVAPDLAAKAPGVTHCYRDVCHRVRTVAETQHLVGTQLLAETSFYDDPAVDPFNRGRYTSNGEAFDAGSPSRVSSSDFPDGTELLIRNPRNGRTSHVRVNDFGPFLASRRLDVTRRVAEDLGFVQKGVTRLEIYVVAAPGPDDLVYRRDRSGPATLGHLGVIASSQVAALVGDLAAGVFSPARRGSPADAEPPPRRWPTDVAFEASQVPGFGESEAAVVGSERDATDPDLPAHPVLPTPDSEREAALASARPPTRDAHHVAGNAFESATESAIESGSVSPSELASVVAAPPQDLPQPEPARYEFDRTQPPALETPLRPASVAAAPIEAVAPLEAGPERPAAEPRIEPAAPPADGTSGSASVTWYLGVVVAAVMAGLALVSGLLVTADARRSMRRRLDRTAKPEGVARPDSAKAIPTIGPDILIIGRIFAPGDIHIAGDVRGEVTAAAVAVLAGGRVQGRIAADVVDIAGSMIGIIDAGTLRVRGTGDVGGIVTAQWLAVAREAKVEIDVRRPVEPVAVEYPQRIAATG